MAYQTTDTYPRPNRGYFYIKNDYRITQKDMAEAKTALIKYIFLDIVGFTLGRSIEAQSDIICYMNSTVREALNKNKLNNEQEMLPRYGNKYILIPTGDGVCIAIFGDSTPYDVYLNVALDILSIIGEHNNNTPDEMRKFNVRIGLNENVDNLITDINENQNVAGNGINFAQRIMSQADGGQILIGQTTYETLCGRERYMRSFRKYIARGKHGMEFPVHQYIDKNNKNLNCEVPEIFRTTKKTEPALTKLVAYYIAHAIKNKGFFVSQAKKDYPLYESCSIILLYFLASDAEQRSEAGQYSEPWIITWGAFKKSIDEQYQYYRSIDFSLIQKFYRHLIDYSLSPYHFCFELGTGILWNFIFVGKKGQEKLKKEWPGIWEEFSLDEYTQ